MSSVTSRYPLRFGGILSIAGLVWLLDWLTKKWVLKSFALGESRRVFSWFYLTYVQNTGTAFGLFQGNNKALLLTACLILGALIYSARDLTEEGGLLNALGVALVMGGAIGNIYDRYHYGQVIDFLDFRVWPVFNLADSAITVGTFCLIIGIWRKAQH